jgi:hypothetical protein
LDTIFISSNNQNTIFVVECPETYAYSEDYKQRDEACRRLCDVGYCSPSSDAKILRFGIVNMMLFVVWLLML